MLLILPSAPKCVLNLWFQSDISIIWNLPISWTWPLRSIAQWWPAIPPKRLYPVSIGILNKKPWEKISGRLHKSMILESQISLKSYAGSIQAPQQKTHPKKIKSFHFTNQTSKKYSLNSVYSIYKYTQWSIDWQWACHWGKDQITFMTDFYVCQTNTWGEKSYLWYDKLLLNLPY